MPGDGNRNTKSSTGTLGEVLIILSGLLLFGLLVLAGAQRWPLPLAALSAAPMFLYVPALKRYLELLRATESATAKTVNRRGDGLSNPLNSVVLAMGILILAAGFSYGLGVAVAMIVAGV